MAQLAKIGAIVNMKQNLKENLQNNKEDNNNNGRNKDEERSVVGPKKVKREVLGEILFLAFCQNTGFI